MLHLATDLEPEWYEQAACRGRGWARFFDTPDPTAAQRTCARCPVRMACLQFAVEEGITYGVWGGLTPEQRRRARFGRRRAA